MKAQDITRLLIQDANEKTGSTHDWEAIAKLLAHNLACAQLNLNTMQTIANALRSDSDRAKEMAIALHDEMKTETK